MHSPQGIAQVGLGLSACICVSKGGVVENIVRPFYVGMHVVCLFVATSMFGLKYMVGVWVAGVLDGRERHARAGLCWFIRDFDDYYGT